MISTNIIVWSIVVILLAGLLVLRRIRIKGREQRKLAPLKEMAAENNAQLADFDSWDRSLIGIDDGEPGCLYFIRNMPEKDVRENINLQEISDCRMRKSSREVTYKKEDLRVIDLINVILSFNDGRPDLVLEFYNNDYDSLTLTGELQLAQKWTALVKDRLTRWKKIRSPKRPPGKKHAA